MSNSVTYKGHKDPNRTEFVAYREGDFRFPLGRKVEDVPDKVAKALQGDDEHEFTITKQDSSGSKS